MTPRLAWLFSVAAGAAVANLYWSQPLLAAIAADFGMAPSGASWVLTLVQLGYAAGILLLLPLGDVLNRRRMVPLMIAASALALVAVAMAPSMAALLVVMAALGVTAIAGQLLVPLAGDLSPDAMRGEYVSTVTAGILIGILLSRTLAGVVGDLVGWRVVYLVAAVVAVVLAVVMFRSLPDLPPRQRMRYPALMRSVLSVIIRERTVRWTMALGMLGFGTFTMFWTALTFLLSAEPYSFGLTQIGLFGLAGLAGALVSRRVGVLHDRGHSVAATGALWLLALLVWVGVGFGARSLAVLIAAVVLIDVALQGQMILNQIRLFAVSDAERSRLNAVFVTFNFVAAAAGSAAAGALWAWWGWTAVSVAGAAGSVAALVVWALGRRGPLQVP
ncbi:MFS transporter [Tessaracoccus sp. SD287]|uniref:MFS transporter n=1 Tax=Tessaracoccus sp. SD287 TaxID=2782008 RepID=UPI001A96667F|nr:MFS transporter [Tessaracoccus sp. SD287]MBO1030074.1 MFS transporter [Tessaracoccus sp. SD287]